MVHPVQNKKERDIIQTVLIGLQFAIKQEVLRWCEKTHICLIRFHSLNPMQIIALHKLNSVYMVPEIIMSCMPQNILLSTLEFMQNLLAYTLLAILMLLHIL